MAVAHFDRPSQYGHTYASTTIMSPKVSELIVWWRYSRIFILRNFFPSNISSAHQLVQILGFKRGYWVIISQFVWMAIPLKGHQDSSWKWEDKTLRQRWWQSIHWSVFCDLVITMCIISPLLRNIALESSSLPEFGFRYFLEKLPIATGNDDSVQLSKWHQRPTWIDISVVVLLIYLKYLISLCRRSALDIVTLRNRVQ